MSRSNTKTKNSFHNKRNNILKQQKMQNQNIKYKNKATQVTEISKVYDLPTILTGYIIFELVGTTFLSRSNKQMINANFKTIEEKIKKQILIQSVTIPDIDLKLLYKETSNIPNEREKNKKNKKSNKKINKNKALKTSRNIYENLCKNEKLQKQFRDIFSCLNQKTKFINIDKMLGIKSFEYPHEICTKCKTNKLKRMARYQGKICVSYGNLEGPQIGRSFLKKCTKCNITFSYGDMETPNSKKRHRLQDLDYFQLSPFTYFKKDIFRSTEFHLLEIARGFEKKVQLYNIDHQHTIKEIQDQLELNKELLGIRLSTNCQLETNRLIDAFYLYTLQKELEEQCDITLSISKNEMLQIKKQKQQRINLHRKTSQTLSQSLSQEEQKNIGISDTSIDHLDLFEFFYTKHQQDLSNIDHGILNSVPIDSDGNVCIGHFSVMMDGNQKNIRACCAYHEEDVFQDIKSDGLTKLTTESLKCPEAPQKSNGSTFGFRCCHHHVQKLMNKGLKSEQCNDYIDWRWCIKKIQAYEKEITKAEKDPSQKQKVEELKQKISNFRKYINKHFSIDDIMDFTDVLTVNHIVRKSERLKNRTAQQKARYIETMVMENENELLDDMEKWLTSSEKRKNIDPRILQFAKQLKALQDERDNEEVIDNLGGCRSGKNTIKPDKNKTGGIFIISTLSGFIIELKEYIHAETSTEVITDAVTAFCSLDSHKNYFERMEALGYDNMCNLQTRLHNLGKQGNLTNVQAFFWDQLRYRTFVDSFHIAKHKCKLCSIQHEEKICCFDANLTKFKEIFAKYIFDTYLTSKRYYTKINDEIVEQLWKQFNQMRFLRSTRKCHFRWLLYLKKKYYNKKRKQQLEDKGYTFIDINEFNKLRHIEDCEGFQWDKSKTTNSIHLQNNKILTKTQRISTSKKRTSSRNKRILHETMCNDDTRNTQKHKKRRLSNIHSE